MPNAIKKTSVVYEIINRILVMVRSGTLKPGERLPSERQLSESLQVSRSSVRAAIQHLAYNNIVEIRKGSGTYLSQNISHVLQYPQTSGLNDVLSVNDSEAFLSRIECRLLVEPAAARLAAIHGTDADTAQLTGIIRRMENYTNAASPGGYSVEDTNFHMCVARASGNMFFTEIVNNYCVNVDYHLFGFGSIPDLEQQSLIQHRQIATAIQNKEPALAEQYMREHVLFSLEKNAKYVFNCPPVLRAGIQTEEK